MYCLVAPAVPTGIPAVSIMQIRDSTTSPSASCRLGTVLPPHQHLLSVLFCYLLVPPAVSASCWPGFGSPVLPWKCCQLLAGMVPCS